MELFWEVLVRERRKKKWLRTPSSSSILSMATRVAPPVCRWTATVFKLQAVANKSKDADNLHDEYITSEETTGNYMGTSLHVLLSCLAGKGAGTRHTQSCWPLSRWPCVGHNRYPVKRPCFRKEVHKTSEEKSFLEPAAFGIFQILKCIDR